MTNRNKILKDAYLNRHGLTLVLVTQQDSFAILNRGEHIDFLENIEEIRAESGQVVNPVYVNTDKVPPYEGGFLAGKYSSKNAARRRYANRH